jgi:UDP-N-acetyl-D-glucosamine dehydrogenase
MSMTAPIAFSAKAGELESLQWQFESRTANLGIIGLGYVGLPLALLFTYAGFPVIGFDLGSEGGEAIER